MFSAIKKVDQHIQAVGNRWQAYCAYGAMLFTAWAVLSAFIKLGHPFFPTDWGWPEAIALGLVVVCVLVLVASFAAIAWRLFFPLPNAPAAASQISGEAQSETTAGWAAALQEVKNELHANINRVAVQRSEETIGVNNRLVGVIDSVRKLIEERVAKLEKEAAASSTAYRVEPNTITFLENDVRDLLLFSGDIATLTLLERQIGEGCRIKIPLGDGVSADHRAECYELALTYIRQVQTPYFGTFRDMDIADVLDHAENSAEQELRAITNDNLPAGVHMIDFRRFKIAEAQVTNLLSFLKQQREEKKREIAQQRQKLLERLTARNPTGR
jgi:hypothetical protein